jgi:hypothetical protein
MIELSEIRGAGTQELASQAVSFLERQSWCKEVAGGHLGFAIAKVIGVFRLHLVPSYADADNVVWVVVGDVPPAYIVLDDAPNWQSALARYAEEMRRWVEAVRHGQELDDVIPVNAPPTAEYADLLARRIDFIEREFVNVPADRVASDI